MIRERVQSKVAVQGNLDPLVLIAGGAALDRAVDDVLANYGKGRLIFNLGHGIQPETPIAHVEQMVQRGVPRDDTNATLSTRRHVDLGRLRSMISAAPLCQQLQPDRTAEFARPIGGAACARPR